MSGLFGRPSNAMQQEVYTGIQVTTSLLGGAIPYVAGRTRVGMNLLWYGNFTVSTSNSGGGKGGGGGGTKQYSYSAAWIAGLCIGPIQGTFNIWHDRSLLNGTSSANLAYENLALALGSSGQAVWGGYPSGTPSIQQIPYDHIAYVASSAYNFGSSAAMPNLTFEVEGVVPGYSDANSIFDADPSAVIPDYLTDTVHGALGSYPGTPLTIGSTDAPLTGLSNSYQAYAMSLGLLTSPYEDTQRQSTDFLAEILSCTNSDVWLSCDTLKVIPYCDQAVSATVAGHAFSYTPNLTPQYIFTDDDYCPADGDPPIKLNRKPQSESYNMLNVEYLDRLDYYNTQSVNASDLADIAKYGVRLAPSMSWHQITQAAVAKTAGQLWLQKQLYERNSYTVRVRRNYALLEGMDYIALNSTDPNLLLTGQLCQVMEIETSDDDKGSYLTITAREIPGVTRTTAQYNWAGAQGYFANYAVDPGAAQAPLIFMMPPVPAALSEGINLGIAVCGQTANTAWLGADVYCSVDGGSTYQYVGSVPEACRYGTLTANLAAAADPDTTNTLSVALANTTLQLSTSVTHAEADAAQTLMLVDTGTNAEVLSYGTAALTSAGHYNLTYLRRQLYGSNDVLHSSGVAFARLDGAIFQLALDPGMAGQTIYFKFVSFNTFTRYGQQTLAGATAYSYTLPSAAVTDDGATLVPRGYAVVNGGGTTVYKTPAGAGGSWDSDAYASQGYLNGCFISFRVPVTNLSLMVGLGQSPSTQSGNETTLDFGIFCGSSGTVALYELGASVFNAGSYAANDAFEVRYDGVTVRYFHNGTLLKGTRAPGLKLFPRICLESVGAQANSVAFGPVTGVTQPGGNWLNSYPWIIGTTPQANQGNYTIISAGYTGSGIVLGGGSGGDPLGPYGGTEPLWLAIGNGTNSADGGWDNTGDLQGVDPSKTYRFCVWFQFNYGTTLSGNFYLGADTTGATNNLSGTVNSNPYMLNFVLATSGLIPGKWYLAVGFVHGSSYGTVAAGIGGVYDPVSGNKVIAATEYKQVAGETFQTHRSYLYHTTTANDTYMYWARPRFEEVNGNEPSIAALLAPASTTWVSEPSFNCAAGLSNATKQHGAANTWDSAVYSSQQHSVCHIEAKANSLADNVMFGFSTQPQFSPNFNNMNYGWYNNAGTWTIYEAGSSIGTYGSVALSDTAAITYDGTTITYLLNVTGAWVSKRTVSVSGLLLSGFCPFYNIGGGLNSLSFGPTTNLAVIDTSGLGTNAASQIGSAVNASTQTVSLPVAGTIEDLDAVSVTVTATGVPIAIDVSGDCQMVHTNFAFPVSGLVTVRRDGSDVGTGQFNIYSAWNAMHSGTQWWEGQVTLTVVDSPAAGSHTYTLHFHGNGGGTSGTSEFEITNATIKVREYRK